MEKTTQILVDEHKNILKIADAIERECDAVNTGKQIDDDFFKNVIDFIRNYADKFHHAKEEDILFKELCKDSVQECMHCNPVEQMLHEHELGRSFVKGIEEGLKQGNKEKILKNARGYSQLIREHIFKEDNILYPMAERVLSRKTQGSMLNKFKKADKLLKQKQKKGLEIINKFQKKIKN